MRRSILKVWLVGGVLSVGALTVAAAAPEVEWGEAGAGELPAFAAAAAEAPADGSSGIVRGLDGSEAPEAGDAPQAGEAPEADDAPQAGEAPEAGDAPQADDAPQAGEAPEAGDAPQAAGDAPQAGEAPQAGDAPQAGEAPEADAAAPAEADVVLETQVGSASYYANILAGRRTASGVRYDPSAAVAAHRELPFGTRLRVANLANGRVVEVEVVDRGPFAKGRVLDLSRSAARQLDFIRQGHTRVRIEVLEYGGSGGR